jgi:type II secretory pathway component PulJ
MNRTATKKSKGYTLLEVLIASSLAFIVIGAVFVTITWTGRQNSLCNKIMWSQSEAMRTTAKIEEYVRNAESISSIDATNGNWVVIKFPSGATGRFVYYNAPNTPRDGKLYLERTNVTETLLARGLTKNTTTNGYPLAMFSKINDRALRISYRVSEPTPTGNRASDDELYAASVRFAVCLRNATY